MELRTPFRRARLAGFNFPARLRLRQTKRRQLRVQAKRRLKVPTEISGDRLSVQSLVFRWPAVLPTEYCGRIETPKAGE